MLSKGLVFTTTTVSEHLFYKKRKWFQHTTEHITDHMNAIYSISISTGTINALLYFLWKDFVKEEFDTLDDIEWGEEVLHGEGTYTLDFFIGELEVIQVVGEFDIQEV